MLKKFNEKKKKNNSQSQGEKFEKNICGFLKIFLNECFNSDKFSFIEEPNKQQSGTNQSGRDINSEWRYKNTTFNWWFECKSHLCGQKRARYINKKEIADKILDALVSRKPPSCYCIISREKEIDNWSRDTIERLNSSQFKKTHFFWWTPSKFPIKKCISFYPKIWKKIYPRKKIINEVGTINPKEKKKFLENIKNEFIKINNAGSKTIEDLRKVEKDREIEKETLNKEYIEEFNSIKEQLSVIEKYVKPKRQ